MQSSSTKQLVFRLPQLVAWVSRYVRHREGGGTARGGGAGSVPAPPRVWDPGRWLPWAPQVRHAAPRGRAAHGDPPRCGGFPEAPRVSQGERGVGGARNGAGRIGVAEQGLPPCRITRCRLYAFLPPPLLTDPPSAPNFPLPGSQLVLEVETPAPWPPPHAPRSPLPLPHGARTPSAQEPPLCPPGARSGRGAASASCLAARRRGALRDRGAGRHLQQGGVRTEPPLGFDRAPPAPGLAVPRRRSINAPEEEGAAPPAPAAGFIAVPRSRGGATAARTAG